MHCRCAHFVLLQGLRENGASLPLKSAPGEGDRRGVPEKMVGYGVVQVPSSVHVCRVTCVLAEVTCRGPCHEGRSVVPTIRGR